MEGWVNPTGNKGKGSILLHWTLPIKGSDQGPSLRGFPDLREDENNFGLFSHSAEAHTTESIWEHTPVEQLDHDICISLDILVWIYQPLSKGLILGRSDFFFGQL